MRNGFLRRDFETVREFEMAIRKALPIGEDALVALDEFSKRPDIHPTSWAMAIDKMLNMHFRWYCKKSMKYKMFQRGTHLISARQLLD